MNWTIFLFGMLGYLVHFTSSWAEYCKTVRPLNVLAYWQQDVSGWTSATLGSVVIVLVTVDVGQTLPLQVSPRLLSVLLGYTGSSVLAKLSGTFGIATGER